MIRKIVITLLVALGLTANAQDATAEEIKALNDKAEYDKVIEKYGAVSQGLSAKSLYYIGFAWYMKENDKKSLEYMDLSIAKDPKDAAAHYIKGSTLVYMGKFEDAIPEFETAITIDPSEGDNNVGLGDAFYNLKKYDQAIAAYKKATELDSPPNRAYSMLAQCYSDLKQNEKALEAYYLARDKISKGSNSYLNALFNIGQLEIRRGDYDKAEPAFVELLQLDPEDYHSYAKLIQVFYHRREYDKAKPSRNKLYEAYKSGKLHGTIKEMFCFDQFKWKDKNIQAWERYEQGDKETIYAKHIFYVLGPDDKIEYKIQTEYSPISAEQNGPKYLLCMVKDRLHSTFSLGFNDEFNYDDMKAAVIQVLEGKLKPSASSGVSK